MGHKETIPGRGGDDKDNHNIENSLILAGFHEIKPPRKGTSAYERLVLAAENYISEVKKMEGKPKFMPPSADGENYFVKSQVVPSSSDTIRRKYHDELCVMLVGKERKELPNETAARVSDFAAYVTGHGEYVGTFEVGK